MANLIKGLFFSIFWFTSILTGYMMFHCALLPILFVSNRMYRKIIDNIFRFWELYPTALLHFIFGTDFIVTGDRIRYDEMSVLVMNHRTRTDWCFFWPIIYHATNQRHHRLKYILKNAIKNIPGAGWVMQLSAYLYIKRDWENDRDAMFEFVQYVKNLEYPCQVLIFPEGTDLSPSNLEKSHRFAEKNKLPKFYNVLHPRTKGFTYFTHQFIENNYLDAVYDITIGYPDNIPQTEMDIVRGNVPRKVHCFITRYNLKEIPKTEEGLNKFLRQLWKDKEKRLEKFKTTKSFETVPRLYRHNPSVLLFSMIFWTLMPFITCWFYYKIDGFPRLFVVHTTLLYVNYFFNETFLDLEMFVFYIRAKILGTPFN